MDWSGVDYCDVFISCLDSHSDGTHSLQRIHWWASDGKIHFSKSNEETNSSTFWMAWGWVKFHWFTKCSFLGELFLQECFLCVFSVMTLNHVVKYYSSTLSTGSYVNKAPLSAVCEKQNTETFPHAYWLSLDTAGVFFSEMLIPLMRFERNDL